MESPNLYISEVMAENISFIQDEFADYPDWIEIYNCSEENILLSDYFCQTMKLIHYSGDSPI